MPLGRAMCARRSLMMKSALQTIASVSATCRPIRIIATLLRINAERIGRISMMISSDLQLRGRLHAARAPGRIDTREHGRDHRERDRHEHHRDVERGNALVRGVKRTHREEPEPGQEEADETARKTDNAGFDEELREHLAPARAERAAQANLAGLARELREQEADRVHEAHREEREAEAGLHLDIARDDLLVLHPRVHVEQAIVEWTLEAAELLLLVDVVVEERRVVREPRGRIELDPHLHPDAIRLEIRVPAVAGRFEAAVVAGAALLEIDRGRERHEELFGIGERTVGEVVVARPELP